VDINRARGFLSAILATGIDVYERETGDCQLIVPILHEDGDMVDIYLDDSPLGNEYVRVCDFGMALMRLSYTFELSTRTREDIFVSILTNNQVSHHEGNLYLDTPINRLYEGILQFAGCVQKVCNMRYWRRETDRSAFYDDLQQYVTSGLMQFSPVANRAPLPDYPIINVDWSLTHNNRDLYLFGVGGNDKAKTVAIYLLEFKKAQLPFMSFVVHEDMDELGRREQAYLTRNADKQYPDLDAFKGDAIGDIYRLTGAPPIGVPT
jgi:hypothetical protein